MGWRPVQVAALDVRLDESRPELQRVGAALFRAGFALESDDPAFGGFSGLLVQGDRLLAVSDQGVRRSVTTTPAALSASSTARWRPSPTSTDDTLRDACDATPRSWLRSMAD